MADLQTLRAKLRESGIPDELHAKFVEFQEKHAGKEVAFNPNPVVWGVLLDEIRVKGASAMRAGEIEAFEEEGVWQVACADIHASDTMTIDQYGRLYWSYQPWYSDFDLFFEGQEPDLVPVARRKWGPPPAMEEVLIVAVDVDYRDSLAVAAGVWFRGWLASEAETEAVAAFREVAPYQSGELYRRELPCLLRVLEGGPAADVVVVDGYVWLGPGRAGLGAHLHAALGGRTAVVGVAKKPFLEDTTAVEVYRGSSGSPLYVTAEGIGLAEAARCVAWMDGPYRIPSLLKRADRLARTAGPESRLSYTAPSLWEGSE